MAISDCNIITDLHDQELKKHGSPSFPIACYADDLTFKNVPWHWHEEWEYAITVEGTCVFHVENAAITLPTGDGIFINTKALHDAVNTGDGTCRLHSAVFHSRLIGGNPDSVFWKKLVQPLLANESTTYIVLHQTDSWAYETLQSLENAWEAVANDPDDFENAVRFHLSHALHLLLQNTDLSETALSEQELLNSRRIRTMLEYIESHYMDDISVADIAASITSSESVCLRCFHELLNTTPMQYVKKLRIQKAAGLLDSTRQSAKEIALSCGFNDISYFTKSFREVYHMTPGQYRKR